MEALKSVKEFIIPDGNNGLTKEQFEINVLDDHLDIPEGELRDKVRAVLDPYSSEHGNFRRVYVCFIGFDFEALSEGLPEDQFKLLYEKVAKECYDRVIKKISSDTTLCRKKFYFFFLPLSSVDKFKSNFNDEIRR